MLLMSDSFHGRSGMIVWSAVNMEHTKVPIPLQPDIPLSRKQREAKKLYHIPIPMRHVDRPQVAGLTTGACCDFFLLLKPLWSDQPICYWLPNDPQIIEERTLKRRSKAIIILETNLVCANGLLFNNSLLTTDTCFIQKYFTLLYYLRKRRGHIFFEWNKCMCYWLVHLKYYTHVVWRHRHLESIIIGEESQDLFRHSWKMMFSHIRYTFKGRKQNPADDDVNRLKIFRIHTFDFI